MSQMESSTDLAGFDVIAEANAQISDAAGLCRSAKVMGVLKRTPGGTPTAVAVEVTAMDGSVLMLELSADGWKRKTDADNNPGVVPVPLSPMHPDAIYPTLTALLFNVNGAVGHATLSALEAGIAAAFANYHADEY